MRYKSYWLNESQLEPRSYTCGYQGCGHDVGSDKGWNFIDGEGQIIAAIYICPICQRPTFFGSPSQVPGKAIGNKIEHLPPEIEQLYEEIRKSTSKEAYTAAVLAGRKLLMHIAVQKGAKENLKFVDYVNYIADSHYAPPNSQPWIDRIRQKANEANHEIKIMNRNDAIEIIDFLEMLLKFIYEFPGRVNM